MSDICKNFTAYPAPCSYEFECRDDCRLKIYEGQDSDVFGKYIDNLKNDGLDLISYREIQGNIFAAFTGKSNLTLLYTPCDKTVRLTASRENRFPSFTKQDCKGNGQTKFYAFENDQTLIDCGMCLMIQCPDDSFFLVDSGHYLQMNDNDRIHKFMRDRTPEGKKIVINGWFITHAHSDHISKLIDFLKYNTDDVIIEGFYENLLPCDYPNSDWEFEEKELARKLFRVLDGYPAPVYKLHTGEKFYVRNLSFEVLSTFEDIIPEFIDDYNDSSTVLMLEAENTKIFIPGDAAVKADRIMLRRYREPLECDIVQVSHHGHTGLSAEMYEKLSAKVSVFPVTRIFFEDEYDRNDANRKAVEIADEYFVTGDGTIEITLPYKTGSAKALPDETFEDFAKIKRLWRYDYPKERMDRLYKTFLSNSGSLENTLIPASPEGWIEPKPPTDE